MILLHAKMHVDALYKQKFSRLALIQAGHGSHAQLTIRAKSADLNARFPSMLPIGNIRTGKMLST